MKEIDISTVRSLFDLPLEKKVNKEEGTSDVYGSSPATNDSETFEARVDELSEMLPKDSENDDISFLVPDTVSSTEKDEDTIHDIIEDATPDIIDRINSAIESSCGLEEIENDTLLGIVDENIKSEEVDLFSDGEEEDKENLQEEVDLFDKEQEEQEKQEEQAGQVKEEIFTEKFSSVEKPRIVCYDTLSDSPWLLESPAAKYDVFYREKKKIVNRCCPGGLIPFTKWREELRGSSIDISVITFDPKEIHIKMQYVQNLRERIKEMQIDVNIQYFLWKRAIVLMRGSLARVESDKPTIKQEGVYYEHMSDLEHYFASLEGLHDVLERVNKTLEGAFECLSRQVTIALPMKSLERYDNVKPEQEGTKKNQIPSKDIEEFDELSDNNIIATPGTGDRPFKDISGVQKVSWT